MHLEHVLRPPRRPAARPPLLVLLHGVGADEQDLLPIADRLDPRLAVASVRGPFDARPMGYAWYAIDWRTSPPRADVDQAKRSREALEATLPAIVAAAGADPARTFLFGFSQGAVLALELLFSVPHQIAGAILHSGRALEGASDRAAQADLGRVHALVMHGAADDVLPIALGRQVRDVLAPHLGDRLTWAEHDAGHFVTEETLADAAAWLSARLA